METRGGFSVVTQEKIEAVKKVIADETCRTERSFGYTDKLADLVDDSMEFLSLIIRLEEEFNIDIDSTFYSDLTVLQVIEMIK